MCLMEELPIKGKVTTSSNPAMNNSLTDGSTETFWESRDEPRGRPRHITVTFDKEKKVFGAAVHIDNQKDGGVCPHAFLKRIPYSRKFLRVLIFDVFADRRETTKFVTSIN